MAKGDFRKAVDGYPLKTRWLQISLYFFMTFGTVLEAPYVLGSSFETEQLLELSGSAVILFLVIPFIYFIINLFAMINLIKLKFYEAQLAYIIISTLYNIYMLTLKFGMKAEYLLIFILSGAAYVALNFIYYGKRKTLFKNRYHDAPPVVNENKRPEKNVSYTEAELASMLENNNISDKNTDYTAKTVIPPAAPPYPPSYTVGKTEPSKKSAREINPEPHKAKTAPDKINFCRRCGAPIEADSKFCIKCGRKVVS
jgi:hypothetical protein